MTAPEGSSSPKVVTDQRQAQVITDRTQLRRLAPFMGRELTVSQAARELNLTVTAMYKITRRFAELGLVQQTRQEQRAGRAMHYYRAPQAFFTPFSVVGLEQMGQLNRQQGLERFERNLALTLRHQLTGEWGSLTGVLPSGESYYEIATLTGRVYNPRDDDAPILLSGWNRLKLTPGEARTLQRQLLDLLLPYLNRAGAGDTYQMGLFLSRDHPIAPP